MKAPTASHTAALTTMLRADHQLIDAESRIVDEPIAVDLVDDTTRKQIAAGRAMLLSPGSASGSATGEGDA